MKKLIEYKERLLEVLEVTGRVRKEDIELCYLFTVDADISTPSTMTEEKNDVSPLVVVRSESYVCGHPPKQTFLKEGVWHCDKCGGKGKSIADKCSTTHD